MGITPDSNTEKLNKLYAERTKLEKELTFLSTRLSLLNATAERNEKYEITASKTIENIARTQSEIDIKVNRYGKLEAEIGECLDKQI